jgi:hypothetical protein
MKRKDPRGNIILFTVLLAIPLMLVLAGVAVDVAMLLAGRSELHRSTDAAALAGAGKLGFESSVFPTVRQFAQQYAAANPYLQSGTISLNLNTNNDPAGDIVLGTWNGLTGQFAPWAGPLGPDPYGNIVNAVKCRTVQSFPTYFLNMIGLTTLSMSAESIAISNPPNSPPPSTCTFPIGVSDCPFTNASTYGSGGCGAVISFINATTNTSGWVNLAGSGTPSAPQTKSAIADAAEGTGGCSYPPPGTRVGMQGGMDQSVYDTILNVNPGSGALQGDGGYFIQQYNQSTTYDVHNAAGTVSYSGHGWEVYVPVVCSVDRLVNGLCIPPPPGTACDPGNMNSTHVVATYARIVIVQVINNGWCGVQNLTPVTDSEGVEQTNPWSSLCPPPNGTAASRDSNLRAIFAFYDCGDWESYPVPVPAPVTSLADHLRLVQ